MLLASLVFVGLQWFEPTGIPLRLLLVRQYNGYLPWALVIAFLADCLIGPLPLLALLVPAVTGGIFGYWYKQEYDTDHVLLPPIETKLQAMNVSLAPHRFDPRTESLVTGAAILLLRYDIPAIYEKHRDHVGYRDVRSGYVKMTVTPLRTCPPGASFALPSTLVFTATPSSPAFCTLNEDASPPAHLLTFEDEQQQMPEKIGRRYLTVGTTRLLKDGQALTQYTHAAIAGLPVIPRFWMECGYDDADVWTCHAGLDATTIVLDTLPGPATSTFSDTIEVLLSPLPPRDPKEIADLTAT